MSYTDPVVGTHYVVEVEDGLVPVQVESVTQEHGWHGLRTIVSVVARNGRQARFTIDEWAGCCIAPLAHKA